MFICDQQQTPHWAFVFPFLSASGKSRRKINATFFPAGTVEIASACLCILEFAQRTEMYVISKYPQVNNMRNSLMQKDSKAQG